MRNKCIVCGADLYEKPLYTCKNMPAKSQDLPRLEDLKDDRPVEYNLCQCSGCGLVQFDCEPVSYYLDSTRAGERSDVLINMRKMQYAHLIETYKLRGKKLLEIGAGKGGFLKTLKEMGEYNVQEFGIEHSWEFVKYAKDVYGVNVYQGNPEAEGLVIDGAPFDAFMSFAYPARLVNPNNMLRNAYNNLVDGGVGLVQVPSLEHLLKPGGFYDVTADHIAYYNQKTLRFLLERNGFEVLEEGEAGSVYIYAIAKKRLPYDLEKAWGDVDKLAEKVRLFVKGEVDEGRTIGVWCAGHFAFTVLSITGVSKNIKYVVDNARFKQGCYTPATHIPIVAPDHYFKEPINTILVLAPFYADEIVHEIKEKYPKDVRIALVDREKIISVRK